MLQQAPHIYVSDVLEKLLDATIVRDSVRGRCVRLLDSLEPSTRNKLLPVATRYGGKCMGFPPIWLLYNALGLVPSELELFVDKAMPAVWFSISTSIADDFIDNDEGVGPREMMFMYMLLMASLEDAGDGRRHWDELFSRHIKPLIGSFVAPESMDRWCFGEVERLEHNASRRIGNFHRLIADYIASSCSDFDCRLVGITGEFGDWCARLDDVFDLDLDLRSGRTITFPSLVLMRESGRLELDNEEFRSLIRHCDRSRWVDSCAAVLRAELIGIRDRAHSFGFGRLGLQLDNAVDRISADLFEKAYPHASEAF